MKDLQASTKPDPTPTPEQPLDGLEVEPDPVYWRGFRDGREAQARPEQDEAVRLRERLLTEIGPERDDAHMCQYRLDLAGVRALLASPPPVPAAPFVELHWHGGRLGLAICDVCRLALEPARTVPAAPPLDVERVRSALREALREWGFAIHIPEVMPDGGPPPLDGVTFIADDLWSRLSPDQGGRR